MASIKGIFIGIILFIIGIPVLWLNEGRAVKTYRALKEGAENVMPIEAAKVDAANEGKLVHVSGKAETEDVLKDSQFGIEFKGIKLARKVEMYQWEEHSSTETKKKVGGSEEKVTTYTYGKDWSETAIDSSQFKEDGHVNPGAMPFSNKDYKAQNVKLGAFKLNESQIGRISGDEPLVLAADIPMPAGMANVSRMENGFYISKSGNSSQAAPEIGDVRVTFSAAGAQDISLCAVQAGDSFRPYTAKNGKNRTRHQLPLLIYALFKSFKLYVLLSI